MKKTIVSLSICLLFAACHSESDDNNSQPIKSRTDIPLTATEVLMAGQSNEFAFGLFRQVANSGDVNPFISPFSATLALSMTANGAAGITAEQMINTLGFSGFSQEEISAYNKKMCDGLLSVDPSTTLSMANSIWIREGFRVKPNFIDINQQYYNAEVRELDFGRMDAVDIINGWCSDKTNGLIKDMLESVSAAARLYLINALYFKGIWTSKFDKANTRKEKFTRADGSKTEVSMMCQKRTFRYIATPKMEMAELPYGNEAFSMVVLLPSENASWKDVMGELTQENWKQWMENMSGRYLDVQLPKFKIEYSRTMNKDLNAMGMVAPFDAALADFSKMADAELFIDFVKQKAFVEVNEEGTEAAAVTVVGMVETAMPDPEPLAFHVNRPFIYLIKEKSTGVILFAGKVDEL